MKKDAGREQGNPKQSDKMEQYDVVVIGAGVSGAAIARRLSMYNIRIALVDKEADVSFGTSKANSGIIHGGFHHDPTKLKARLEVQGNLMFDQLQRELHFPFSRCGILVAAMNDEEMKTVQYLYDRGRQNGAIGIELCSRERILDLEPKLTSDVVGGLYAPGGGIIEPYRFVFALVESAQQNGVQVITDFEVQDAEQLEFLEKVDQDAADLKTGEKAGEKPSENASEKPSEKAGEKLEQGAGKFKIQAADGRSIIARYVVNAAGLYADTISQIFKAEAYSITPRKGEYYLLDRMTKACPGKVLFPVPNAVSKGMLVIPTVEGTVLVGPTAEDIHEKDDLSTSSSKLKAIFDSARQMIPKVSTNDVITSFSGLRPTLPSGDFYIEPSAKVPNFIHVAGIQSPGLTAAPAIAEYVKDLLKGVGLELRERSDYRAEVKAVPRIRNKTPFDIDELIQENPAYGNIVCRCENISEAEIIEAIRRGHDTLDGIKFFTRSGMGRCQGGFCTGKIIEIIMRETGKTYEEVSKRGKSSTLIWRSL